MTTRADIFDQRIHIPLIFGREIVSNSSAPAIPRESLAPDKLVHATVVSFPETVVEITFHPLNVRVLASFLQR
jgi:hypothetical protein